VTQSPTKSRWWRMVVLLAVLALFSAACAEDDDDDGDASGGGGEAKDTITISGPETGSEADGFTEAFEAFTEDTGIEIEYSGTRDFETQIRVAAEGGELPDLAVVPQPGLAKSLADKITEVPDSILDDYKDQYNEYLWDQITQDGKVLGVPNKADVKSLVWYSPKVFKDKGYEIPETWDAMLDLADEMKADGITPWCVGIESGEATGWPLTDWMEDIILRMHGPDVYDDWVDHSIPFNDPKVEAAAKEVEKVWFTQGNVLNGRQSIASTGFKQAGLPILEGECGMHRMANFYAADYKDAGATFGEDGDVNVFYLPTMNDDFGKVMLTGGTYIVAFNDNESTLKALEYIASADYADNRIKANKGGFISPNTEHDTSLYGDELDRTLAELLVDSDPVRFDGADLMPSEVGAGTFWKEGTNWVLGSNTLKQFLDNVEASWPDS
jgi:alpha-glucoside transport system substrate-binding protein